MIIIINIKQSQEIIIDNIKCCPPDSYVFNVIIIKQY